MSSPEHAYAIRRVEEADWPALRELGAKFYAEARLQGHFNPDVFEGHWRDWTARDVGVIFVLTYQLVPVGAISALIAFDPNNDEPVAQECFWFVDQQHRKRGFRLLSTLEDELKTRGVVRFGMIHLDSINTRLGPIYERLGYVKQETFYLKTL